MELIFLISLGGLTIVLIINRFHKSQQAKLSTVSANEHKITAMQVQEPAVQKLQAEVAEEKVIILKALLRYEDDAHERTSSTAVTSYTRHRDGRLQEFKVYTAMYNGGQLSPEAYNQKLDQLLQRLNYR